MTFKIRSSHYGTFIVFHAGINVAEFYTRDKAEAFAADPKRFGYHGTPKYAAGFML